MVAARNSLLKFCVLFFKVYQMSGLIQNLYIEDKKRVMKLKKTKKPWGPFILFRRHWIFLIWPSTLLYQSPPSFFIIKFLEVLKSFKTWWKFSTSSILFCGRHFILCLFKDGKEWNVPLNVEMSGIFCPPQDMIRVIGCKIYWASHYLREMLMLWDTLIKKLLYVTSLYFMLDFLLKN